MAVVIFVFNLNIRYIVVIVVALSLLLFLLLLYRCCCCCCNKLQLNRNVQSLYLLLMTKGCSSYEEGLFRRALLFRWGKGRLLEEEGVGAALLGAVIYKGRGLIWPSFIFHKRMKIWFSWWYHNWSEDLTKNSLDYLIHR